MRSRISRSLVLATLVACTSLTVPAMAQSPAPSSQTGELPEGVTATDVLVNGRSMRLLCIGEPTDGVPTVIAEAGLGGDSGAFGSLVPPVLGTSIHACAYDRAGLGASDPPVGPVTTADGARDLHALLEQAGIEPPYVLLAHSIGGWYARVFTATYPDDVVGLVLIDSSHPDQTARFLAILPPETPGEPDALRDFRDRSSLEAIPSGPDIGWLDIRASEDEVRASGDLGERPLVVLTRDPSDPLGQSGLPEPYLTRSEDAWLALQDELASLSTKGVQRTVLGAGHAIQVDRPEAVMEAIEEVIADVAAGRDAVPDDGTASPVASEAP